MADDAAAAKRREALQYFMRVESVLDSDELDADEDQRRVFVANVLKEMRPAAFRTACDSHCSRVLEKLVKLCSPAQTARLARVLRPDYEVGAEGMNGLARKHASADGGSVVASACTTVTASLPFSPPLLHSDS